MSFYARTTRRWLDQRFCKNGPNGAYLAHMPIYGLGHPDAEGGHLGRLARFLRLLRALDGLSFESVLDVGGAEGWWSHAVRTLFGARTATTDLSLQACLRARELFGLPAAAVDCARLPFADGAFDVVVCSEVLEHVEHPVATLLELCRVARRTVLLTTEEVRYDRAAIDAYLFRRPGWPHMERNLFHPDDSTAGLPGVLLVPQCDAPPPHQAPATEQAIEWLLANTTSTEMAPGRIGVVATIPRPGHSPRTRSHGDRELLEDLLRATVAPGTRAEPPGEAAQEQWLSTLRDPHTHRVLQRDANGLRGSRSFPVTDGVPDFVDVEAPAPSRAELVERLVGTPQAQREALLSLHDRLALPERWTQDVFDLRQREHRRGFWPNDQLTPRTDSKDGDGFRWRATGPDPWVVTPFLQRPLRALELELRIHAPGVAVDAGTGQVFWKGPDDETFTEANSVLFPVHNDGRVHRYRIELAGRPNAPAEVQWLRIDPVDGPCEVDLLSLRLE
jgi:SAM-dependent methyltransferase